MNRILFLAAYCLSTLLLSCGNKANDTNAEENKPDTTQQVKQVNDTTEAKGLLQGYWKIIPPPGVTNEGFGSFTFEGNSGEMYIRMGKGINQRTSDSSTYAEKSIFTYTTAPLSNNTVVLYAYDVKHSITEATGYFKKLADNGTMSRKWKDKDTMRFKFLSTDTIQALPDPKNQNTRKVTPLVRFYRVK